jgi:hypothetical protein
MEKEEEERRAEEQRVREAEKEQLEEQKRNEERWQLEEKRREAEKRKKEDRKRREEEKRLAEEKRWKRMEVVEAATAQAKKKKKELDEQKELEARVDADKYKLFLVKEAEREKMRADEAKKQLAKKSEEADRARMAKAEKDWQELQEKESAEGVPLGASVFSYRSKQADRSREAFESVGNLRDRWNEASLEKGHWFDSDLCILEPMNSTQMAVFEQLKVTGLLCSRFSATVKKGRRFFALAGKDVELPNGKGGKKNAASKRQAASPVAPAPDGGSPVEGEMAEELLAVPGPSGVDVGASGGTPPVLAASSAASKECWVINPGIGPKVIVRRISSGPAAAAEAAAPGERRAGEPVPELGLSPAARRAAAETRTSPVATTSRPAVPVAAAPGKRKAKAGVAGGSQKRKKSSPVKIKDL